jgi:hypothetical protein
LKSKRTMRVRSVLRLALEVKSLSLLFVYWCAIVEEDSAYIEHLKLNLSRLIVYADSADIKLQREVAEKLANEAVKASRQIQIVEYGGLKLLVPLAKSSDIEVQRLAAHALANLSVNGKSPATVHALSATLLLLCTEHSTAVLTLHFIFLVCAPFYYLCFGVFCSAAVNQEIMAKEGAIDMLIGLIGSPNELIQRQSAKALANLGVNSENKRKIALAGGIPKLVTLAQSPLLSIKIEAIAALANLAVNDENELDIVECGGLIPIVDMAAHVASYFNLGSRGGDSKGTSAAPSGTQEQFEELGAQCARALRNLSVHPSNKDQVVKYGAADSLLLLVTSKNDRVSQQARRALKNIEGVMNESKGSRK